VWIYHEVRYGGYNLKGDLNELNFVATTCAMTCDLVTVRTFAPAGNMPPTKTTIADIRVLYSSVFTINGRMKCN